MAYLTQTTLSVDDAEVIIAALKRRFPEIVGPSRDDICYATQNRQEAVKELVPEADAVIVLGSQNSSNSHAAGGAGPRRAASRPTWWTASTRSRRAVSRPRDGADYGRGQRPGRSGGGVRPHPARALRGHGGDARWCARSTSASRCRASCACCRGTGIDEEATYGDSRQTEITNDHGRPMRRDEFEAGEYEEGYKYELIDGKIYVSPQPNAPEGWVE